MRMFKNLLSGCSRWRMRDEVSNGVSRNLEWEEFTGCRAYCIGMDESRAHADIFFARFRVPQPGAWRASNPINPYPLGHDPGNEGINREVGVHMACINDEVREAMLRRYGHVTRKV
jgi:hypothetical protein